MTAIGRLDTSSIGKKFIVAITGLGMVGFLLAHLLGNLRIFEGADAMNEYAELIRFEPLILWMLRLGLIAMVVLHIVFTVRLTAENRAARPESYAMMKTKKATVASRAMVYAGVAILFYIIYHLLHLTFRVVHTDLVPYDHHNVYANVINSFQNPLIVGVYVVAQIFLFFHLKHGFQSAFRTLGVSHPGYLNAISKGSVFVALLITGGFISIPVAIFTGLVK